jgi:hypothetical protein
MHDNHRWCFSNPFKRLTCSIQQRLGLAYSTDFILEVKEIKNKQYKESSEHSKFYPVPGYGIPPEEEHKYTQKDLLPKAYGMFLAPGRLKMEFINLFLITWVATHILLVLFLFLQPTNKLFDLNSSIILLTPSLIHILTAFILFFLFSKRNEKPVLNEIWREWAEPCYSLLGSVPHRVKLHRKDKNIKRKLPIIYWNPTERNYKHTRQNPREYSSQKHATLQSVLLNFAQFEVFFKKRRENINKKLSSKVYKDEKGTEKIEKNGYKKYLNNKTVLHQKEWLYQWMAPVTINYIALVFSLFTFFMLSVSLVYNKQEESPRNTYQSCIFCTIDSSENEKPEEVPPRSSLIKSLTHALVNGSHYLIGIFLWIYFSYRFIYRRIDRINKMKERVISGYFFTHEEMIPQRVLNRLVDVPTPEQMDNAIQELQLFLHILFFGAVVIFLMAIQLFASNY